MVTYEKMYCGDQVFSFGKKPWRFAVNHGVSDFEGYNEMLFSPDRLSWRMKLFEKFCLPSVISLKKI